MAYVLIIERGPRPGLHLAIPDHRRCVLGTDPSADVLLPAEDGRIAARHAEIDAEGDPLVLRPYSEGGGTRVNGHLVTSPTPLSAGDSLQLGETHLVLEREESLDANESIQRLSVSDIVETVRSRRFESRDRPSPAAPPTAPVRRAPECVKVTGAVIVEREVERLSCTYCGSVGIAAPRPDLWDASWICPQCVQARRAPAPGMPARVGGFDLIQPLARGGMGVVYEAVARDTGLHVALKVLARRKDPADRSVQRFVREQHITKALRHPNIVYCYDVGMWDGMLYIASEFVAGGDALAMASPTSPLQEVLWLGADLFRALGYGHDLGVVHRDVKPANLLVARTGPTGALRGKLADFGLAKSYANLGGPPITRGNESGGSLLTISPEQLTDFIQMPVYGDLYAGAATLFWILTGKTPLVLPVPDEKASFEQKAQAILQPMRRHLRDLRPDVPAPVASLLDGLVAYEPSMRASMHAREVAVALNAIASRMARRPPPQPATVTRVVQAASAEAGQTAQPAGQLPEAPSSAAAATELHFKEALCALERCIRMLELAVERAAVEVREAADADDPRRLDRVVAAHAQAQGELEVALARWERIISPPERA